MSVSLQKRRFRRKQTDESDTEIRPLSLKSILPQYELHGKLKLYSISPDRTIHITHLNTSSRVDCYFTVQRRVKQGKEVKLFTLLRPTSSKKTTRVNMPLEIQNA